MARKAKQPLSKQEARAQYREMLEKCQKAQDAHPKLYLLDEGISAQNASDGLFNNEGRALPDYEIDYTAVDYEYLTRNLENDTAMRMAEAGLDPSVYGLRF